MILRVTGVNIPDTPLITEKNVMTQNRKKVTKHLIKFENNLTLARVCITPVMSCSILKFN